MNQWYDKKIMCGAGPNPNTTLRVYGASRAGLFARAPRWSAFAKLGLGAQKLAFISIQ